ncbi:hypothetical protein EBQ91_01935 [bacterium]|nr:hypothetical protein [bacterium]
MNKSLIFFILNHQETRVKILFYCCYYVIFMVSLKQFQTPIGFQLGLIFMTAFIHLKRVYALPAIIAQGLLFPQYWLINIGYLLWLYVFLPLTYLKYNNPLWPILKSIAPLLLAIYFYPDNPIIFIINSSLSLWLFGFLITYLPNGLNEWKKQRYILYGVLIYCFLCLAFLPSVFLAFIPLTLLIKNTLDKSLSEQIFTILFLSYYVILVNMIDKFDMTHLSILLIATLTIISDGASYHEGSFSYIRRNQSRSIKSIALKE